jgi:hypothetical protein
MVLAVVRLGATAFAGYPAAVGMFDDDAFYYFGIARHIAAGDGSTFDGLEPTNGYHPLWLLVLVPVFVVAKGKAALVGVTLVSSVLFVLSARLIDRIGMLTGRPVRVACCAVPLLVVGTIGPSFWFSGMETGLMLFGLLWLAATYVRTAGFTAPWFSTAHACGVGALMALVVLARLDAVFTVAVLGVLAVPAWRAAGLPWVRFGLLAVGIPVVVLGGYVAINLALFDTAVPVSGQAKALGGASVHAEAIGQFLAAPVVFGRPSALGAIAVAVVVGAVLARVAGALGHAARFAAVVLAGGLLAVAYYAVTSSWHLWPWYFSAAPVAVALAGPALLQRLAGRRLGRSVLVVLAVLGLCAATVTGVRGLRGGADRSAYIAAGPRVAAEIDALVPGGAPIAMGDRGGSVGYHLTRPLVQLEGLVGSTGYLDALADGTVPRLLADQGVAFYARGDNDSGQPDPEHRGCSRFTEPQQGDGIKFTITVCAADLLITEPLSDGTSYRVWRYLPQLNS